MTIIANTLVNWTVSPRIITIPTPITEVTIIDLQDTLTDLEDDVDGMSFPHLRNTSGGEALGGGVTVGWTMELQNAQVQFEGRTTALTNGTPTTADSNGKLLIDSTATFLATGVSRGDTVFNSATGSMGTVLTVDSETQLTMQPLTGGARFDWQITDSYVIYHNEQCNVAGGNLSAVDENGAELAPTFQSPNTNVVRTASSSATNSDVEAIQYSSYGGGVTIDVINGVSGVDYPAGNQEFPVNNPVDALEIAETKGFRVIFVRGALSLNTGDWSAGYTFIGQNPVTTTLTLVSGANVNNCELRLMRITGVMDDNNIVRECLCEDLSSYDGVFYDSSFIGRITLGGSLQTTMLNCKSGIAGGGTAELDFGGDGSALAVRDYTGGIRLINKTGTDACSIDLISGQIQIDATVVNSAAEGIIIRGQGKLVDNSTPPAVIDHSNFLQSNVLQDGIERSSYIGKEGSGASIKPSTGTDSIEWPYGTRKDPCATVHNAHEICEDQGFRNIYAMESITINESMTDGYKFIGDNPQLVNVNMDVLSNVSNCEFQDCYVTGIMTSSNIIRDCIVGSITNGNGFIYNSSLLGPVVISDNMSIEECWISPTAVDQEVIIDFDNKAKTVIFSDWSAGRVVVKNMITGSFLGVSGSGGRAVIDISNAGGMLVYGGAIDIDDTYESKIDLLRSSSTASQVWNTTEGKDVHLAETGRRRSVGLVDTIYEDDNITPRKEFDITKDLDGSVIEIVPR